MLGFLIGYLVGTSMAEKSEKCKDYEKSWEIQAEKWREMADRHMAETDRMIAINKYKCTIWHYKDVIKQLDIKLKV